MPVKIINKARTTHLPHVLVLLVLSAFGLMVFFSYIYLSGAERRHLQKDALNVLVVTQSHIESALKEFEPELNGKGSQPDAAGFDAALGRVKNFAISAQLTKGGYGVLVRDYELIAHPNPERLGKHVGDLDRGAEITRDMRQEKDFFEYQIKSFSGESSVLFYKRLANGWYLGIVTPRSEYYADMWTMTWVLILLGAVMATLLSAVLLSVVAAKNREDAKRHQAEEYARLLLDATPLCCQLWDQNFNTIDCNEAGVRLYKLKDKREYVERFFEFMPEYQPDGQRSDEKAKMYLMKAIEEGQCVFEWMHRMPDDGTLLPAEITLVRIKYKGDYIVAGYTRDLREVKALAEIEKARESMRIARDIAEAANKAKSVFLANMSHEIRTPMNSIIGFTELAMDDVIPQQTREYLGRISASAMGLLAIINDILDVSKIEAGKMELERIPFDLRDVFAHCQSVIMPKATEKGISLYCYAEPSIGKKLIGDPVRLRQTLINILANAVKFTNVGTVKLSASVRSSNESRVAILFEVKDSGIGMTPEQVTRVLQPFTQADNSITRKYGGTGLGLTITQNLIELMGGALEIESMVGVGSRFSFELAFDTIDDVSNVPSRDTALRDIEKPNFEGEVLVCEDNRMNQHVIREHLKKVGLEAVIAGDGKEGVAAVASRLENGEKPFDLIFMDIHMPVMDGLEAASKITALGVKTPIVAVTANIMSNDLEHYKKNGISDHLGKPFTTRELWGCLIKHLQ